MSAPAHAIPTAHAAAPSGSKFHLLVRMATILAAITGLEVVLVYLPVAKWIIAACLAVLLIVKFAIGVYLFMHLKWDKLFCTVLFLIGLILAGGTVAALIAVFSSKDSVPLTSHDVSSLVVGQADRATV